MHKIYRPTTFALIFSVIALLTMIGLDWNRQLKQINKQQEKIVEIGRSYGEVMWRVTSARRWWIEYNGLLALNSAKGTLPSDMDLAMRYQFFTQNIADALALQGDVIEIAQEALISLKDVTDQADMLHSRIIDADEITDEMLIESDEISSEIVSLASDLGTFKYVYFGPEGTLEPFKRDLMIRSVFMLAGVFLLAISAAVIHRRGFIQEQEAEHSKLEALGALAAGYSHAISSIVGGLQIIIDTVRLSLTTAPQIEAFAQLDIGVQRLRLLNTNLSTIARGNPTDDSQAPVSDILRNLLDLPNHPDAPLTVKAKISNSAQDIHAPQIAIGMIGLEMISNARNHRSSTTSEPTIWINVERTSAETLRLVFKDNGRGITPRNVSRVLDPFFSTTGEGHAGLGLTSVKSMVESMGGSIIVQNRASGPGAKFTVELPLVEGAVPIPRPQKR